MEEEHNGSQDNGSENTLEPLRLMVSVPTADLQASDSATAEIVSQLLYGEEVHVLDTGEQWLRVRSKVDGYEGYAHQRHFSSELPVQTHRITNRATLLFGEANIKSPVLMRLTFGARMALLPESDGAQDFLRTLAGHFVWKTHCQQIEQTIADEPVSIVRQHFLCAPYLWGGRSSDGLDCSGLVQLVASMVGVDLPRDSVDQEKALPEIHDRNDVQTNDLVFWPGHVAWIVDPDTVIHANAASLNVREEPLEDVNQRAGPPSSFRRIRQSIV